MLGLGTHHHGGLFTDRRFPHDRDFSVKILAWAPRVRKTRISLRIVLPGTTLSITHPRTCELIGQSKKVRERYIFPRPSSFAIFPAHKIFPHLGPSLDDVSSPHMVIISPLRLLYEDVVTSHWLMHDASNPSNLATAHRSLKWKLAGFCC